MNNARARFVHSRWCGLPYTFGYPTMERIMKSRLSLLALCLALGAVVPTTALADDPKPADATAARDKFAGNFGYVGGEKQNAAREAAIEKATDSMSFITRPIARSRLKEKTQIRQNIGFAFGGGNITMTASDVAPAVSPENGSPGSYKSGSDTLKLVQKINGNGQLVQQFIAEDGGRTSVFSLSADGKTLNVSITVTSSKLPEAVKYNLTYQRK